MSSGYIGRPMFIKATRRAGFVFTSSEIRMLMGDFSADDNSGRVAYKKVTYATVFMGLYYFIPIY